MTRHAAWVALAAFGVAVGGCGPAKEVPTDLPEIQDGSEKSVAVPAASEPDAKAYVDKALKAFTAGKPEVLARGKFSRAVYKGKQLTDGNTIEVTRTIAAVWPDRLTDTDDRQLQGRRVPITAYMHRPRFVVVEAGRELDNLPSRAEIERNFAADQTAQHWMATLLPLTDPKAKVFDLRSADVSPPGGGPPQAVRSLKLALPDYPVYQLVFDAKTDLLIRVEYTTTEQGAKLRKQWSVLEHKAGPDGQLLPAKTECRHNGALVEQWEAEKWEFPATIDDSEFAPPKK